MSAKVLIIGLPNTGKSSLLKPLKNVLVFSRDGKPFPFELLHANVPDFKGTKELISFCNSKIQAYKTKFECLPKTIVFDSVSRIFTDIVNYCNGKYSGFEIWKNVDKEINSFVDYINLLNSNNINIIIIAHAVYDVETGTYTETCKGSFSKIGGFLSTVDYSIHTEIKGKKRILNHRGTSLSRNLLSEYPDVQDVSTFNLQEYVDKIEEISNNINNNWSI